MNHNNAWSHRLPDPCLNLGCIFILPEENKAAASASGSMAYHSLSSNTNLLLSSNSDLGNYRTANLSVACDPYIHHSSVSRSCLIPHFYTHGGSYYNQYEIRGSTSSSNSEAEHERAYFKRKSSVHPIALDVRNSDQYRPNLIVGPHSLPHNSISMLPERTINGHSTIGEGSGPHRNVRSRHGDALHMDNNLIAPHASSSLSHHVHQTTSTSSHEAMLLDSGGRLPSSGFFHHEMNQPIASSGASTVMEIDEGFSSNEVSSRHRATLVLTRHAVPMQDESNYGHGLNSYRSSRYNTVGLPGTMDDVRRSGNEDESNYGHRLNSYRSSRYNTVGLPGTMDDVRRSGNEVFPHLRHHRQSFTLGQSSDRYGRMRSSYDTLSHRMNTLTNEGHAHGRWNTEDAMMIDRSAFNDSHAMFDQHRNMRMDIDNLSYEELVDLGERIGNVSTGLSGGDIARCLTNRIYSFDRNKAVEQGSCVICLEEYKDGQSIGRLNCRHDFHSRCIKKWLLIKNACPICKSAALGDKVKGKQVLSM